ncbi:MAG: Na/Pi cotransporter family protein [Saccharofermentanales bacterium]|jgi:phosphate:Na+ symporter
MNIQQIFMLFGGLALFIFGMQQMGEGLEKAAGDRMRRILEMLTSNPLMGVLVGTLVTMIIQSSSATTVIVIGFVSAGLMTLSQAIGVIFGANIGTTMTAWIIAVKIDNYAWLFVVIGFLMMMIKKPSIRYIGQISFGFGVLFVGLNSMGDAMKPLAASPQFAELLLKIKDVPVLGLIVGAIATMVVQSSSAAIGVLQTLAASPIDPNGAPLVSLYQAVPILFGSNIGTTITAILASIGGSRQAKRTAAAHSVFNISGSILFLLLLRPYTFLANSIMSFLGFTLVPDTTANITGMMTPVADSMRQGIAVSHTFFNVICTLVWLPFIWLLVKIVKAIVPGEDIVGRKQLAFIDYKVVSRPAIALGLATNELARMTALANEMIKSGRETLRNFSEELIQKTKTDEDMMDFLDNEIVRYLSNIVASGSITPPEASRIAGYMHATNDIERIGDHCENITDIARRLREDNIVFSESAKAELDNAFEFIEGMVGESVTALQDHDLIMAQKIIDSEDIFDKMEADMRSSHLDRLNKKECNPHATVYFLELMHILERISDHCKNIAEVVIGGENYLAHPSGIKMPAGNFLS